MRVIDVQFDYFRLYCYELDVEKNKATEKIFDLHGALNQIKDMYSDENEGIENKKVAINTTLPYRDEEARIQTLQLDNDGIHWGIQILRLRDSRLFSGVAAEDGDFKEHYLENGEKIGESTTILYNSSNYDLLIQRNRNAMTPSAIVDYLNEIFKDRMLSLKPQFIKSRDLNRITKNDFFRKLEIGICFDDLNNNLQGENERMGLIGKLASMRSGDGNDVRYSVSVGMGAKKDASISRELIEESIGSLYENSDTSRLRIRYKENYDTKVEEVDLLDDRKKLSITIEKEKNQLINHKDVYPELLSEYKYSE